MSGSPHAFSINNILASVNRPYSCELIQPSQLDSAKIAYSTRRVPQASMVTLLSGDITPCAGDVILAEVQCIGQHQRIELVSGRRAPLFHGDLVVVCYGNRYAPDQFESIVPENLDTCHLVAGGGIASQTLSRSSRVKAATEIKPLGLMGDSLGHRLNLADWALPLNPNQTARPFTIAVVGTAMNAGKTTTAAHLIKGLIRAGMNVGAAKITGTGSGRDAWLMLDAGAKPVVDFTDAGFASTYLTTTTEIENIAARLTNHLHDSGVNAVVLEIADGLLQRETADLLLSPNFQASIDGILFAAGDALGAVGGVNWLQQHELPVLAVSGALSASPLASREAAKATGLPTLGLAQLSAADIHDVLMERLGNRLMNRNT